MQVKSLFRVFKIPSGSRLWPARNYWARYALHRTATSANVSDRSSFKMRFGTVPPSPIPFLKPEYVKTKRQDKLRPEAFPCFFMGPLANRPRDQSRNCCLLSQRHMSAITSFSPYLCRKCAFCVCFKEEREVESNLSWRGGSG